MNDIVTMTCLRRSTGEMFEVKYNIEDAEKVKQYEWKVQKSHNSVYAILKGTENILLHRLIYGNCKGKKVLAKNGNYFDCTRENLYLQ